jgi:hypothetical protein
MKPLLSTTLAGIVCFVLVLSIYGGLGFAATGSPTPKLSGQTLITMGPVTIDTAVGEPYMPDEFRTDSYLGFERGLYLIQFNQNAESWMLDAVEELDTTYSQHINPNTYMIEIPTTVEDEARALPFVQWMGICQPWYKISEEVGQSTGLITIELKLTGTGDVNKMAQMVVSYGGTVNAVEDGGLKQVRATIETDYISALASYPTVVWISQYHPPQAFMDLIRLPEYTGADTPFTAGFDGSGVLGQVKDNGCDLAHYDLDNVLYTQGGPGPADHGTCTTGIVFSNGDLDGDGDPDARGMLPAAEGSFSDWGVPRYNGIEELWDSTGPVPGPGFFESNSWSQGTLNGQYTTYTNQDDSAMYDFPHVLMLYAAGNCNSGQQWGGITQDSAMKNGLCVGALWHENTADMSDDSWYYDPTWSAGSRGFAADSRLKPDLCGPYDYIFCTDWMGANGYRNGDYVTLSGSDMYFGGTSGATPVVAGQVGLAYEMYMENHFGNNPLGDIPYASTIKAMMMADAYQYPDFENQGDRHEQGWGSADIENTYLLGASGHYIRDWDEAVSSGTSHTYYVSANGGGTPLKISLTWTEPAAPSSTGTGRALINNLDLTVISPGGASYYGNNGLNDSAWSSSGTGENFWAFPAAPSIDDHRDGYNNVENVFIQSPLPGMWTIVVSGRIGEVPDGPMPFSLVASGAQEYVPGDPPSVTVTDPNGGVNWEVGTFQDIRWTMSDPEDPPTDLAVTIDYSVNGGATYPYNIITAQTGFTSPATYNWQVSNTPSPNARVRVTAVDTSAMASADESDNDFTIYIEAPIVNVISPDVGDSLMGGGTWAVSWTAIDGTFPMIANPISIYWSTNAGGPWNAIPTDGANDGSEAWDPVPAIDDPTCYLRITAEDTDGNIGEDISGPFEIDSTAPAPPSNPRAEISGIHVMVYWDPSPSADVDHYEVYYSMNNWNPTGASYGNFLDSGGPGTSVQHSNVGINNGNSYFYQVRAVDDAGHQSAGTALQAAKFGSTQSTFANPTGWFLLGSGLVQTDTSIAHVIQGQGLPANMDCLRAYDTATDYWSIYIPTAPPSINTLTDITEDMGFWMHITSSTRYATAGYVEDKSFTLIYGWNLVPYPFAQRNMNTAGIETHLMANCPGYGGMLIADHTQPYQLKVPTGSENIFHNQGFWVWVNFDTTWAITNY